MAGKRTRVTERSTPGFRQVGRAALVMVGVLTLLPALLFAGEPVLPSDTAELVEPEEVLPIDRPVRTAAARDKGRAVRLQKKDGTVEEITMADYLWGVVAAEMPAAFEEEALKAQACAARTYTVIQQGAPKHEGADICGDSTCCQAYVEREEARTRWGLNGAAYEEKVARAVAETDGLGVLYGGAPIQALFFSSTAGQTVDAVAVWGSAVDYLKSVDSPEGDEVPNYRTQVSLSAEEVKQAVLAAYPGADLTGKPEGWFGAVHRTEGGTVTSLTLGGITLTGGQVRALFALRSAAFTVDWDGEHFTFDVTGYGHGVGMSQYGANAMAKEGKDFRDILTWYYTGTQVAPLW